MQKLKSLVSIDKLHTLIRIYMEKYISMRRETNDISLVIIVIMYANEPGFMHEHLHYIMCL